MKRMKRSLAILFTTLLVFSTISTPIKTFADSEQIVEDTLTIQVEEQVLDETLDDSMETEQKSHDELASMNENNGGSTEQTLNSFEQEDELGEGIAASTSNERAPPVTVNVRVETDEKTLVPTTEVTVENFDLRPYGGPALTNSPRAIHAIIRALETVGHLDLMDKKDFELGYGGNYIVNIDGLAEFSKGPFSGWKYFIDHQFVSRGVLDREIENGESIVLYYTTNFNETYASFDQESYSVEVNKPLEMELSGVHFGTESAIEGASILINEDKYTVDGETVFTDENGKIEIVFSEPGTYHLSAHRENDAGERDIVRPYAIVKVTEQVVPDLVAPTITVEGINDEDVVNDELISFTVKVSDDVDGELTPYVEVNGSLLDEKDGTYEAYLNEGNNTIVIIATDEAGNKTIETFTIHYEQQHIEKFSNYEIDERIQQAAQYILETGVYSEWQAIGLARAGYKVPESYLDVFYGNIESQITNSLASERLKITDAERLILAALAIGEDPENVAGHDLIDLIYNSPSHRSGADTMTFQGNNGPIFALIALDSKDYPEPVGAKWTRQKLINELLKNQNEDGSWHLSTLFDSPSIDITAMAITSLSPYKDQPKVKAALDKTINYLSSIQTDNGGFDGGAFVGGITSEATAQVIIGLTTYGIDPTSEQFTKNGNNLIDHLLSYQNEDGGFRHTHDYVASNSMATEQALQALIAYQLFANGEGRLYHFGTKEKESENDEEQPPAKEDEQPSEQLPEEEDKESKETSGNEKSESMKGEIVIEKVKVAEERVVEIPKSKTTIGLPENLPVETTLTVIKPDVTEMDVKNNMKIAGDLFDFQFDFGESTDSFTGSFELTLGVHDDVDIDKANIYHFHEGTKKWERIEAVNRDEENRTITVIVDHFSMYGVFVSADRDDDITSEDANGDEKNGGTTANDDKQDYVNNKTSELGKAEQELNAPLLNDNMDETEVPLLTEKLTKDEKTVVEEKDKEHILPITATNTYQIMFIGIGMVILGSILFFMRTKRRIKKEQ